MQNSSIIEKYAFTRFAEMRKSGERDCPAEPIKDVQELEEFFSSGSRLAALLWLSIHHESRVRLP